MKKSLLSISLIFCVLLLNAQPTITSVKKGLWSDTDTWSLNRVPNTSDVVLVQHDVDVTSGPITIQKLEINNGDNHKAGIVFDNGSSFSVTTDVLLHCQNYNQEVFLNLLGSSVLNVTGDVNCIREANNGHDKTIEIRTEDGSSINITNNLNFTYAGSTTNEEDHEIEMFGTSQIVVGQDVYFNVIDGRMFELHCHSLTSFTCGNQFTIDVNNPEEFIIKVDNGANLIVQQDFWFNNNSTTDLPAELQVNGHLDLRRDANFTVMNDGSSILLVLDDNSAVTTVGANLNLVAFYENDINIDLLKTSNFYLGGNVSRVYGYGNISMSDNATWHYAGTGSQNIAGNQGSDSDYFNFTNIVFANIGGTMVLEDHLEIKDELALNNNIISTSSSAMITIADGATISGGSPSAYIDGPIKKINPTETNPFTFPLGNKGKYAPMAITPTGGRAGSGEYTAQYLYCPPPWGGERAENLDQISDEDHWVLESSIGAGEVNVTLHWSDAEAQGITDLDSLVVAMYNPDVVAYPGFPAGWTSIGNGGTTGGTGNGTSGSVMNMVTCPPPWGIQNFTLGSTDGSNALPLEMESFTAQLSGETVDINWATILTDNLDHYILEKSLDAVDFSELEKVDCRNQEGYISYKMQDRNPKIGTNYYRLKQIDVDGMIAYTDIIYVEYNSVSTLFTFPNPIQGEFTLRGGMLKDASRLTVSNAMGMEIYKMDFKEGNEAMDLDVNNLNIVHPGIYFLQIFSEGRKEVIEINKF